MPPHRARNSSLSPRFRADFDSEPSSYSDEERQRVLDAPLEHLIGELPVGEGGESCSVPISRAKRLSVVAGPMGSSGASREAISSAMASMPSV